MRGTLPHLALLVLCVVPLLAAACGGGCDAAHPAIDLGMRCPPNAKCLPPMATLDCGVVASVEDTTATSHVSIAIGSDYRHAYERTLTLRTAAKGRYRVIVNETASIHRPNGSLGGLDDLQPGVMFRAIGGDDGASTIAALSLYIISEPRTPLPTARP